MVSREAMEQVEGALKSVNEPPPLIPSAHHFADCGIYARETYIPEDTIVMGKIHRYSTINFITMGMVKAINPEQPDANKIMVAPYTFVSPGGSKRCVVALADSIWITVHKIKDVDSGQINVRHLSECVCRLLHHPHIPVRDNT